METIILDANSPENVKRCAEEIRRGGLVALPTETVYGLGANALNEKAVLDIFSVKGRPGDNPLIVHVASRDEVLPLVSVIPDVFEILAETFWPGPLTLVMQKSPEVPAIVTAGLDTVAIRVPGHPAALALLETCGCPIAAPSANPSGRPSPTTALHVKNDLDGRIPFILDGGDCRVGLESTVLDITGEVPRILRPGGVTYDELAAIVKEVDIAGVTDASDCPHRASDDPPRSPGMKYRHYAPKAPLTAVLGTPDESAEYIKLRMGDKVAALMFDDHAFDHPNVVTYGRSVDHEAQAARLFGALRMLDGMDISEIYAQTPDESGLGHAVANRIKKAAGKNIVDLSG